MSLSVPLLGLGEGLCVIHARVDQSAPGLWVERVLDADGHQRLHHMLHSEGVDHLL